MFIEDETGLRFESLANDICFAAKLRQRESVSIAHARSALAASLCCMDSVATTVFRISADFSTMQKQSSPGGFDDRWFYFAQADLFNFHVVLRSLHDHVAALLVTLSGLKDKAPSSFRKLREWATKSPKQADKLGPETMSILNGATWFDCLRVVRDRVVHYADQAIPFNADGRLCFALTNAPPSVLGLDSRLFANPNIVDFSKYGGLMLGGALRLLDDAARQFQVRHEIQMFSGRVMSRHPAHRIIRAWIEEYLALGIQ